MTRFLLSLLGLSAAIVFGVASAAMNHSFMQNQGATEYEGHILGAVAVAVSLSNAILPFLIGAAWARGRRLTAGIGSFVFLIFLSFALLSALGFASGNRNAVAGSREALTVRHGEAAKDLAQVERELAALNNPRPPSVIEAELGKARQDRVWATSKACEEATAAASRDFCKSVFDLRRELAASVAAARMGEKIASLKREARQLEERGAGRDRDPQARLLAELSGFAEEGARRFLVVFVACLVELGAAFLPFLAFAPWRDTMRRVNGSASASAALIGEMLPPKLPARTVGGAEALPVRTTPKRVGWGDDGALIVRG